MSPLTHYATRRNTTPSGIHKLVHILLSTESGSGCEAWLTCQPNIQPQSSPTNHTTQHKHHNPPHQWQHGKPATQPPPQLPTTDTNSKKQKQLPNEARQGTWNGHHPINNRNQHPCPMLRATACRVDTGANATSLAKYQTRNGMWPKQRIVVWALGRFVVVVSFCI